MSVSIAITTKEKVKGYMGISLTDTDKDDLLDEWLEYVSGAIEDYLCQPVVKREVTEHLDGNGGTVLYLNTGRIASLVGANEAARLANLQYRDDYDEEWEDLVEDEDAVFIDALNPGYSIELLDGTTFPSGRKNIKVKYNCGFETIPPSITKVCLEMMQVMYDESKAGQNPRLGLGSKSDSASGSSGGDNFLDMNPRWKSDLTRWRKL